MRYATALLFALSAVPLLAEVVSTRCLATEVQVQNFPKERLLLGCDASHSENLLWHLDRADSVNGELDGLFHRGLTGRGTVIYFIDTGIKRTHVEFQRATGPSVIAGINTKTPLPGACDHALDPCSPVATHGTSTASIAAGANLGIAPDAMLVSSTGLSGTAEQWNEAVTGILRHAFDPATPPFRTAIINISGGIEVKENEFPAFDEQLRRMTTGVDVNGNPDPSGKRFLFVVAALNDSMPMDNGHSTPTQCTADGGLRYRPGTIGTQIEGVVTVGGMTRANKLWQYSCRGPLVEVVAPAENMFLASIGGNDHYRFEPLFYNSGTSYATPYVSGIAALYLQLYPLSTPAQLEAMLKASPSRVEGMPVPIHPAIPRKRRAVR